MNWKILESSYIVKDKWLGLRQDKCLLPNGRVIPDFYVMEFPDWANVVAVTPNHEIVMVKVYRHGLGVISTELPGGGIETKDKSPLEAAKRELLEETGYSSDNFKPLCKVSANPDTHTNFCHSFLATDVKLVSGQKLDPNEEIEIVVLPVAEVKKMIFENKIYQSMHIAALFYAFHELGI